MEGECCPNVTVHACHIIWGWQSVNKMKGDPEGKFEQWLSAMSCVDIQTGQKDSRGLCWLHSSLLGGGGGGVIKLLKLSQAMDLLS